MLDTELEFDFLSNLDQSATQLLRNLTPVEQNSITVSFEKKYLPFPEQKMDFAELVEILD